MSDLDQHEIPIESIQHLKDLPDGSSEYFIGDQLEPPEQEQQPFDFNENIASKLEDKELDSLASKLLQDIQEDRQSRSEWENAVNIAYKYLGFKIEEFRSVPFMRACGAFDSTMASAVLRAWSVARAELFPMSGPVVCEVLGSTTEDKLLQAERVSKFLNYYLKHIDKPYYPDSDRLLLYLVFYGCAFRKVYQDPILNRPVARFIEPQNFIVDHKCVSLLESARITQELFLTKKDIMLRQMAGVYKKDVKLPRIEEDDSVISPINQTIKRIEGINNNSTENKNLFKVYEVHADLTPFKDIDENYQDEKEDKLPLPYIVTILATSKKILAIHRNWVENDQTFKRKEYFVHYQYLPGFGIYSLGLAQLCGSNAITLTSVQRQLIDAGTLKNFPGGLIAKGLRLEENDKAVGPATFLQVDTGGAMSIRDAVMPMPYAEPSVVLKELSKDLKMDVQTLTGMAETQLSENRPDAPVGTTLALLENASRVQSSIMRTMHVALSEELSLLFKLFSEYLGDSPYPFSISGQESAVLRTDFNESIQVLPVSDPNLTTTTQRIIRAEALLKLAQSAPQIHDIREAYERMYKAMNVEDIEKLLPPPPQPQQTPPLDPVTEVANAMNGKPIVAAMWQDHQAHVMVKMPKIQELSQQNPQAAAALSANVTEHNAMQYILEMQMQMGIQLPPLEQIQDPNVQNEIAIKAAEVTHQLMAQMNQQMQQQQPIDPNMVMMADIEQKKEATLLKHKTDQQRIELDAFNAQLNFESEKNKMEIQKQMAHEKNIVTLEIAGLKKEEVLDKEHEIQEGEGHDELG